MTPEKVSRGFEHSIWGSPVKKQKGVEGDAVAVPGNPLRQTREKHEVCIVCGLDKRPAPGVSSHGAKCHYCTVKLQFFCRKYGLKCKSHTKLSEMQLGHLKAESIALRKQKLQK